MSAGIPILSDAEVNRLSAIAALIQSDQNGEVVNAARMLVRNLAKHGLRIGEVVERALKPVPAADESWRLDPVAPCGVHQVLVRECLSAKLNDWEAGFVRDLMLRRSLTQRQAEVLTDIVNKVRRQRGAGGET